ncbi:hypothetical protein FKP32DRAFT_1587007 [Trametes sanguinea]|nr:hypothetical protein FKP32DRAFT_1587007 [Trametes sanguinea]
MPPYPPPLSLPLASHRSGILLPSVQRPTRWSLHYFLGIIIPSTLSSSHQLLLGDIWALVSLGSTLDTLPRHFPRLPATSIRTSAHFPSTST